MKTLRLLLILFSTLSVIAVVTSCTDLTEEPFSEITEENFNPTADDIPRLLAPAYTNLRWYMGCCYDYVSMQEGAGDSYITPSRPNGWGGPYLPYHWHEWTPTHLHVSTGWNNWINGVNAANRVLYQVQNLIEVSPEVEAGLVAEIRALRAFNYYNLLDNYGSVPIVTDFLDESLPSQSSRQEVFEFVETELLESIPDLTETLDQSTYGRMHKWAAMTVLARLYLNAEVYTGTERWDDVIEYTDRVIDSGLFQLEPDFRNNFVQTNQNSSEIIFAIPYDEVFAGGNSMHMRTLAPEQQQSFRMSAQPWGGSAATPQSIDTYDDEDTRLDDTWSGGPQTDPQGNVVIDFTKSIPEMGATQFRHGYRVNKYEIYEGMTGASDVDYPVFRYSLVLMMKAEALLRNGAAGEAASLVTEVRERAFSETDPSKATVTGAELEEGSVFNYGNIDPATFDEENDSIDYVNLQGGDDIVYGRFLDELLWEFTNEGFRRQDMIRFETTSGESVYTAKRWFEKEPSENCREVFPVPQSAIDDNPNLEQVDNCF